MDPVRRVTNMDLFRVFLRMLFLQGLLHAKGMQNMGIMNVLAPALTKLDTGEDKQLIAKHLNFFNCNPNFTSLVVGSILRMEEDRFNGKVYEDEQLEYFKRAISSPLAAMGDMFFLGGLKPLSLTLACIFAIYNSFIGLLAVLLFYNAVVISCRLWGVYYGYSKGWDLVDVFSGPAFQRLLGSVQSIGASVGGALVAVVLVRLPHGGTWMLGLGVVLMILAVYMLRRDVSSARFAILLMPVIVVIAMLTG